MIILVQNSPLSELNEHVRLIQKKIFCLPLSLLKNFFCYRTPFPLYHTQNFFFRSWSSPYDSVIRQISTISSHSRIIFPYRLWCYDALLSETLLLTHRARREFKSSDQSASSPESESAINISRTPFSGQRRGIAKENRAPVNEILRQSVGSPLMQSSVCPIEEGNCIGSERASIGASSPSSSVSLCIYMYRTSRNRGCRNPLLAINYLK